MGWTKCCGWTESSRLIPPLKFIHSLPPHDQQHFVYSHDFWERNHSSACTLIIFNQNSLRFTQYNWCDILNVLHFSRTSVSFSSLIIFFYKMTKAEPFFDDYKIPKNVMRLNVTFTSFFGSYAILVQSAYATLCFHCRFSGTIFKNVYLIPRESWCVLSTICTWTAEFSVWWVLWIPKICCQFICNMKNLRIKTYCCSL